jgi:hypothetical protein
MSKLLKRWYVWFALFMLLSCLSASTMFIYSGRSRINQENVDRIWVRMSKNEVQEILGRASESRSLQLDQCGVARSRPEDDIVSICRWKDGPRCILVVFDSENKVLFKEFKNATAWQFFRWHANRVLGKVSG